MTVLVMMKGRRCVDISVLRNPRHEQFAQLVATGNPPAEAYVWIGFSKAGAAASATRLLRNAPVRDRVEELQHGQRRTGEIVAAVTSLPGTDQRQDRAGREVRAAKLCVRTVGL